MSWVIKYLISLITCGTSEFRGADWRAMAVGDTEEWNVGLDESGLEKPPHGAMLTLEQPRSHQFSLTDLILKSI